MPAKIGHDLHDMTTPNNTQFLLTGCSNTHTDKYESSTADKSVGGSLKCAYAHSLSF